MVDEEGELPKLKVDVETRVEVLERLFNDRTVELNAQIRALNNTVRDFVERDRRLPQPAAEDKLVGVIRDLKEMICAGRPSATSVVLQIPGEAVQMLLQGVDVLGRLHELRPQPPVVRPAQGAAPGLPPDPPAAAPPVEPQVEVLRPEEAPPGMGEGPVVGFAVHRQGRPGPPVV